MYKCWTQEMYVEFIRQWEAGEIVADIAAKFKVKPRSVLAKVAWLRRKGVLLTKRKAGAAARKFPLDFAALSQLVPPGHPF